MVHHTHGHMQATIQPKQFLHTHCTMTSGEENNHILLESQQFQLKYIAVH